MTEGRDRAHAVRTTHGGPLRSHTVAGKGTTRGRAEEAPPYSEESLQAIISAAPIAITSTDCEGRVTMWSPAAEALFGWAFEEIRGEPAPFVLDGELDDAALRSRALAGEVVVDCEVQRRHKDGTRLTVSLSVAPLRDARGSVIGTVSLFTDLTARTRAEVEIAERSADLLALQESLAAETAAFNEQLRRSARDLELLLERERDVRETLSAVVSASPVAIVAIDSERRITMWNPGAERTFGWTAEEVLLGPVPYVPPDEEGSAEAMRDRVLAGEIIVDERTTRMRKDGTLIPVSISQAPLPTDGGEGAIAILTDITERLQSELQLRAAEERYRNLLEQIPAVVYIDALDGGGTTEYVSPNVEGLLGITPEEWVLAYDHIWTDRMHPDDRGDAFDAYARCVERGEPLDIEYRLRHNDGSYVWFRDQGRVLPATESRPAKLHGVMVEITELKRI